MEIYNPSDRKDPDQDAIDKLVDSGVANYHDARLMVTGLSQVSAHDPGRENPATDHVPPTLEQIKINKIGLRAAKEALLEALASVQDPNARREGEIRERARQDRARRGF